MKPAYPLGPEEIFGFNTKGAKLTVSRDGSYSLECQCGATLTGEGIRPMVLTCEGCGAKFLFESVECPEWE